MSVPFHSRLTGAAGAWVRSLTINDAILLLLVVAACSIGATYLVTLPVIENEGGEYATIARNIDRGIGYVGLHGTPEVYFPPVYPVSISLLARITGGDLALAGRISALIFGVLAALMAGLIAGHWFGRTTGFLAAAMILGMPLMLGASTAVLSETTYMACALAGILLIWIAFEKRSATGFAAAGTAMGLAHLTKPEVMIYATLLIFLRFAFARGERRRLLSRIPVFFIFYAVVISPHVSFLHTHTGKWMIEGKSGLNTAIAIRTAQGETLDQACRILGSGNQPSGLLLHPMDEVGRRSAIAQVLANPLALPTNALNNIEPLARSMVRMFGYVFLLLAIAGFLLLARHSLERFLYLATATGFPLLLVSSFWIFGRYVVVVLPLLAIAAAYAVFTIVDWLKQRFPSVAGWPGFMGLTGTLIIAASFTVWPRVNGPKSAFPQPHHIELKAVGDWLRQNGAEGKRVMSLATAIPFYCDATWITLPISTPERTLAYAEEQRADFIVVRADEGYVQVLSGRSESGAPREWRVVYRETARPYNPLIVLAR